MISTHKSDAYYGKALEFKKLKYMMIPQVSMNHLTVTQV